MSVCERCAGEDDDLEPVWPLSEADADSEEPELWCVTCRETHPHEPADTGGEAENA